MVESIRVAIVDDDALVRVGLRMMLGGDAAIEVVGEAADGAEGVALILREQPDIALMDIRMPVLDGLSALQQLSSRTPAARVIVLTTFDADDDVLTALRHGAAGFLLKDTPPNELVDAVHRVARGEPMLSPTVTSQLIRAATRSTAPDPELAERASALTQREREVAAAVARGLSNAQIGEELFLSVATVKTHIGHLFEKLAVTNRVQLARRAHDLDIH